MKGGDYAQTQPRKASITSADPHSRLKKVLFAFTDGEKSDKMAEES